MPPILALDKISKRFGAIVIADGIDLALAEGEALGIIGPNGAGKTTLFGIMTGTVPPMPAACCSTAPISPACRRRGAAVMGIARSFQIPQPFGGMTVFENLVVAAAFGDAPARARRLRRAASICSISCGLADKANRHAGTLTLARPQAARARARARDRAARPAPRRDRGRPDRARMRRLVDADQGSARATACRSSGSSTSCMR